MSDDRVELAAQAYIYGYPLVADLEAVTGFVHRGAGSGAAAPFNEFAHADASAGPTDRFGPVDNDTVCSLAQLDLSGGPLRLRLPDTGDRYAVFQLVDAWTNSFAYLGADGVTDYLLVPPGGSGEAPGTVPVPTMVATLIARFGCAGPADLPAVAALRAGLTLTAQAPDAPLCGVPHPDERVAAPLDFYEKLRVWLAAFPPSHWDQEYQERFAALGLEDEDSPYLDPDPALADDLIRGHREGQRRLDASSRDGYGQATAGWRVDLHLFDYNLDHLETGTRTDPQWKIHPRAEAYRVRARAARLALWGNHAYQAVHAEALQDAYGEPLSGLRSYTVRFRQPPPCDGFWSLAAYDHLAADPVDRYPVGDRTPGLRYAADGSLTLVLSHDPPGDPDERANWLPTPAGQFRPVLRIYRPGRLVLDGGYGYPPIVPRTGNF